LGCFSPATARPGRATLPFVICGPAVLSWECLSSATALPGSVTLPFVISTGAQRSGEICGPAVLSWECFSPATALPGSATLPFVICGPAVLSWECLSSATALPGSAILPIVISTGAQRSGEICGPAVLSWECFSPATALPGSATLPIVISTGAQRSGEICGPAVLSWNVRSSYSSPRKRHLSLCHLDRSVAQRRDLCVDALSLMGCFSPATALPGSATLPFVISTGAQRSGGISVWMLSLGNVSVQLLLSPEAPPFPLSSRPERSAVERSLCGCSRSWGVSVQLLLFPEAPAFPLSSRPERSAVERSLCGCSLLGMFFDRASQIAGPAVRSLSIHTEISPLRYALVEKHPQERTAGPQVSPLRSLGAPVEMTKGRLALPGRAVDELKHPQERTAGPQVSPLRSLGAPVEMTKGRLALPGRAVDELKHPQERTAGPQISPLRSFGAPVEMTKGRVALPGRIVAQPEGRFASPPLRCAPAWPSQNAGHSAFNLVP
jgi:hypothetical protein